MQPVEHVSTISCVISSPEEGGVPLYSLAFGQDADLAFLKRLSLRAGAFARKIYEAADAALQLRDFYRQVASPLLSNVTFNYSDTQVCVNVTCHSID